MTCPQCQGELTKTRVGYMCFRCGFHSKTARGLGKAAASKVNKSKKAAPPNASDAVHETENVRVVESQPDENVHPLPVAEAAPVVPITPSEPEPVVPAEPLVPVPPSVPTAASHGGPNPPRLGPAKPVRTATLIGVGLGVLVILTAVYVLPALAAARSFNTKLASAKSFRFSGNLTVAAQSFLQVLDSNVNYHGSYSTAGSQVDYSGLFGNRTYAGQFVSTKGQLYSKMTGSDLPFIRFNQGIATYHILPDTWYQTKADTSLYKYYCETRPDTRYPSPLIWYQAIRQIKLHPSPLVEYGQQSNGHATIHLRGDINPHDLNNAWANVNSSLPTDCQWNNLIDDVSGLKVSYDLWTSSDYDQIKLHYSDKDFGISGSVTLDLDQYNQATAPVAPANAQDLANIFSGRQDIQTRDYARRANIDALNAALKKYYAANKKLPSSLAKLAPKYIPALPVDPSGQVYVYTVSKKTYTLSATLEDAGQLYIVSGP